MRLEHLVKKGMMLRRQGSRCWLRRTCKRHGQYLHLISNTVCIALAGHPGSDVCFFQVGDEHSYDLSGRFRFEKPSRVQRPDADDDGITLGIVNRIMRTNGNDGIPAIMSYFAGTTGTTVYGLENILCRRAHGQAQHGLGSVDLRDTSIEHMHHRFRDLFVTQNGDYILEVFNHMDVMYAVPPRGKS